MESKTTILNVNHTFLWISFSTHVRESIVCYTAVFSVHVVTQRSSPLRDDTKTAV